MLKYYIKIAFRNFIKYKSYFLISVFGLSIGMAVCIMLLLYVQNELSYDRFNTNADNIYRLCQPDHPYHPPQTARILADGIPEIEDYGRLLLQGATIVQYDENRFKETDITYADPGIFRIFSFKFISGNAETALSDPFTIIISEKIARKYFGNENPMGKILKLDNTYEYTVSGVIEDMPLNSHFRYDIFMTLTGTDDLFGDWANNWGWQNFLIYFLMQDEFSEDEVIGKAVELITIHAKLGSDDPTPVYFLQCLKDIHLHSSHIKNDIQPQNSITYVLIFSGIGIMILLIACFNYINLLSANATSRANEIGVKKVVGASRNQLLRQFMGESFILLLLSISFSLIIIEIAMPLMNGLLGKEIAFKEILNPGSILGVIGIVLITGILAGSYPAFFLSSIQPVKVLKGSGSRVETKSHFRRLLVITQFTIVIILISSAITMLRQINYLQNKDLGFQKENIYITEFDDFSNVDKYLAFKHALLSQSSVEFVSAASRVPSGDLNNFALILPQGDTEPITLPYVHVSFDYFETLGISASQGRLFSNTLQTDIDEGIILNKAAVELLGIEGDPIGQQVQCYWPYSNRTITGVIDDIHFESLFMKIKPQVFVIFYEQCEQLLIRIQSTDTENTLNQISEICKDFYPELMFEFHSLDERLEQNYQDDKRTFKLMVYFTALAMFIACIGLFGLASFILKHRIKEIGIHKIFGSTQLKLMKNLSGDFVKWVLIACIIAWPFSWFAMERWIESFAYRVNIGIWVFLFSGVAAMILALITVSWLCWRTARKNPVEALQYE